MGKKKMLERKVDDLCFEISSLRRENGSLHAQSQMMEKIIVQNLSIFEKNTAASISRSSSPDYTG